jgi:hypothetical protein
MMSLFKSLMFIALGCNRPRWVAVPIYLRSDYLTASGLVFQPLRWVDGAPANRLSV